MKLLPSRRCLKLSELLIIVAVFAIWLYLDIHVIDLELFREKLRGLGARAAPSGTVPVASTRPRASRWIEPADARSALAHLHGSRSFAEGLAAMGRDERIPRVDSELIRSLMASECPFLARIECLTTIEAKDTVNGNTCLIDGWYCHLANAWFIKEFDLKSGRRYRVTGRFVTSTPRGSWTAEECRITAVPTLAQAKVALIAWLRSPRPPEVALLPGSGQSLGKAVIAALEEEAHAPAASVKVSEYRSSLFHWDVWVLLVDDLTFTRRFCSPDGKGVYLIGRFELGADGALDGDPVPSGGTGAAVAGAKEVFMAGLSATARFFPRRARSVERRGPIGLVMTGA